MLQASLALRMLAMCHAWKTCCAVQVHTYEELTNSFRDVSSKCHSLISDGGKEITKLLSSSNRTLKVSKGAPAWKAYVDYIGDIVIDGLVECIIASVHRLTAQASHNFCRAPTLPVSHL